MITLVIDDKSQEAKKMLELLQTRPYAKIIKVPNSETLKAIKDAENGKVNHYKSSKDLMANIRRKANV